MGEIVDLSGDRRIYLRLRREALQRQSCRAYWRIRQHRFIPAERLPRIASIPAVGKAVPLLCQSCRARRALLYRDLRWRWSRYRCFSCWSSAASDSDCWPAEWRLIGSSGPAPPWPPRTRTSLGCGRPTGPRAELSRPTRRRCGRRWPSHSFWNLVSAPVWFILPGEIFRKGNLWALLFMLFPIIGLFLAGGTIFCVLRWLKFGQSEFQMADVPGRIGGQLAGVVRTSAKVRPDDGFHVALRCVRQIITGSGSGAAQPNECSGKTSRP